jgi:hypothetical protein
LFAEKRTIDAFQGRFVFFSKGQSLAGIGGSILPVVTKFESSRPDHLSSIRYNCDPVGEQAQR